MKQNDIEKNDDKRIVSFESDIKRLLRSQDNRGDVWHENLIHALRSLRPESFQAAIRAQLRFRDVYEREASIPKAYEKTYEWIFKPPKQSNWDDFVKWLTSDEPLYWITGKPGSGKSTLMKFIASHDQTKQALAKWAGDTEIWLIPFFFWNSGSDLQMSQEGLIRSILLQALERMPELADTIFKHRSEAWALSLSSDNTWSS